MSSPPPEHLLGTPDREQYQRINGVRFHFRYYHRAKQAWVGPDPHDLQVCRPAELLTAWARVGWWAVRFRRANPGWLANGEAGVLDGDPDGT